MVIISGVRFAGKVDAVPRVGHVATRFFHLYWIPLIPVGTFLVTEEKGDDFKGFGLPLNAKSIVVGYLRTLGWLGFAAAIGAAFMAAGEKQYGWAGLALAAALLAAGMLTLLYRLSIFTRASYERAIELARHSKLPPEHLLMIEVAYGRMNADQAERALLKQLESAGQPTS
jgi:peptidoglycan/LPS O-acetylase OafA/YrhL